MEALGLLLRPPIPFTAADQESESASSPYPYHFPSSRKRIQFATIARIHWNSATFDDIEIAHAERFTQAIHELIDLWLNARSVDQLK